MTAHLSTPNPSDPGQTDLAIHRSAGKRANTSVDEPHMGPDTTIADEGRNHESILRPAGYGGQVHTNKGGNAYSR